LELRSLFPRKLFFIAGYNKQSCFFFLEFSESFGVRFINDSKQMLEQMESEVREWVVKAESDLRIAEKEVKIEEFEDSVFHSQQAAEKILKALQIKKLRRFDKVHDLEVLAKSVDAPKQIREYCIALSPFYTILRYPIDSELNITMSEAVLLLNKSKKGV
jgi:HEPN domain-containing protein